MSYKLLSPIKYRKDGQDAFLTELELPSVVTVKMMRQVKDVKKTLSVPIDIAAAAANLTPLQKSGLELPDALAYVTMLNDAGLLDANEESAIKIPQVKPVMSLINRITADTNAVYDFAAQVLILSGANEAEINAMDARDLMAVLPDILNVFTTGKAAQG